MNVKKRMAIYAGLGRLGVPVVLVGLLVWSFTAPLIQAKNIAEPVTVVRSSTNALAPQLQANVSETPSIAEQVQQKGTEDDKAVTEAVASPSNVAEKPAEPAPVDVALAKAKELLGVPYKLGGENPARALDCSAYVQLVFSKIGVQVGRNSFTQFKQGTPIAKNNLIPGDLVFFHSNGPGASHVGIYLGNGEFIHESPPKVQISKLTESFYVKTYHGAKRVLPQ